MDYCWILIITVPFVIFCIHKLYNIYENYEKTLGKCLGYEESSVWTSGSTTNTYKGTYLYVVDGKEYKTTEKKYSDNKRPKTNKEVDIYVRKNNPSDIIPASEVSQCKFWMIFAILLSVLGILL